jgi:hypothetical protein
MPRFDINKSKNAMYQLIWSRFFFPEPLMGIYFNCWQMVVFEFVNVVCVVVLRKCAYDV